MSFSLVYEQYPILEGLGDRQRERIEQSLLFREVECGEYLMSSQDSCFGMILVLKGRLKVHRIDEKGNETVLYELGAGQICHDFFGGMLGESGLSLMASVVQDGEVAVVPGDVVGQVLLSDVGFVRYLYQDLYRKMKSQIDYRESFIHESLENRLMNWLMNQQGRIIYATHQEIASHLSSSREVISRYLKRMEQQGDIQLSRGKIELLRDKNK